MEPLTSSQILEKLEARGYELTFRAHEHGLIEPGQELIFIPEELRVDAIYRFEGESNVDDEEIIFALSSKKHDVKGIFHVAYGAHMDPADSDVVLRLQKRVS